MAEPHELRGIQLAAFEAIREPSDAIDSAHARIAELHGIIDDSAQELRSRQMGFLSKCAPDFRGGSIAAQFDRADDYHAFLARVGRDQHIDPTDRFDTTSYTAQVIGGICTAETIIAAYVSDREDHWKPREWTVGRIEPNVVATVAYTHLFDNATYELLLAGRVATANAQGKPLSISVSDIAEMFDESRSPGAESPFIVAGEEAGAWIKQMYLSFNGGYAERYGGMRQRQLIQALGISGLRLSDLGVPEDIVAHEQARRLRVLSEVIHDGAGYRSDVFRLVPLCTSNQRAFELIQRELPEGNASWGINRELTQDLEILSANLEPETVA